MAKHAMNVGVAFGPSASRRSNRCIACKRHIAYGDRCEEHKQQLRQRKRRKPR